MQLRIATFNVENLFQRPSAMADGMGEKGQQAIDDHAELNRLIARPIYADGDKKRLLELERRYHFADLNVPANALVLLNKVRGQLFARSALGVVSVKARGRSDWTGWFELRRSDVRWRATYNTARVIASVNADIVICVEVENRPALQRFNEQVLGAEFERSYRHPMVIDGNDSRGIDVGLMSRYPIVGVRPHVDDRNADSEFIFSRDCPEYLVQLPQERQLVVVPNHFKFKRGGNDARVEARRLAQATAASKIAADALATASPYVLLGGDLNDTPGSAPLAPLLEGELVDVQSHPDYPTDRPGTYGTGLASDKIDYLLMSPALRAALVGAGVERRGSYHPNTWEPFDTVDSSADEASDHHLVWAEFEL